MAVTSKVEFYLGTVVGIHNQGDLVGSDPNKLLKEDSQFHHAIIDIPGVVEGVIAYPRRGEIDEPKVGDLVFVTSLDPVYGSYYLFEKLQENDFVGFRAHGKMIDITHDYITIGVFDEKTEYKDADRPDCSKIAHIKIDKDGNVDIHTAGDVTAQHDKNVTVNIDGNATVDVKGTCDIKSPDIIIHGGKITGNNGVAETPQTTGPFNAIPICPFTGVAHACNVVIGS